MFYNYFKGGKQKLNMPTHKISMKFINWSLIYLILRNCIIFDEEINVATKLVESSCGFISIFYQEGFKKNCKTGFILKYKTLIKQCQRRT